MSFRSAAYLAAVMTLAPLGLLAAQQAAPSAAPEAVPAPAATEAPATVTPAPAVPAPQYSPLFQKSDPEPVLGTNDNAAVASGAGNHTIVLSTLALILVIVILVLLIA